MVESASPRIAVWHCDDLRIRDNAAAVDGLDRTDRPRDAYDWGAVAESYFGAEPIPPPDGLPHNPLDEGPTVETVRVDPHKCGVPTVCVGTAPGVRRVALGVPRRHRAAEERTSHLSPYLQFGCLPVRSAKRYVDAEGTDPRGTRLFEERCYWNRHYSQKILDWPGWTERAVNPVFRGLFRDSHDPELVAAWKRGETGDPLVDASMRPLRETVWLNFRTRAMCGSFYTYILQCWWKVGADHFYRHLIDGDAAINYTQWQSQSNLTGEFVRRYVAALHDLPTEHLARPERTPLPVQESVGVRIGEDYPRPVVDFEARRDGAKRRFDRLAGRAREALSDPAVRRRASLSQRHGREADDDGDTRSGQRRLDDFRGRRRLVSRVPTPVVPSEFSGDVMDVLGQLFDEGAAALDDGDPDTARQCLTSAETVATNKLPDGEFRSRLLHGCDRALSTADADPTAAAEHCRVMAREVDANR